MISFKLHVLEPLNVGMEKLLYLGIRLTFLIVAKTSKYQQLSRDLASIKAVCASKQATWLN